MISKPWLKLVRPARFELATYGFVVRRSIQTELRALTRVAVSVYLNISKKVVKNPFIFLISTDHPPENSEHDLSARTFYFLIHKTVLGYKSPMDSADDRFMAMAIDEAKKAADCGEVPVGAILVSESEKILSMAHNAVIATHDPTAHAEIRALRKGSHELLNYRLLNTTLYVTIEPCVMCMGAMIHARIDRLVYGAPDPKWGAAGSLYNFGTDSRFNHVIKVTAGVYQDECRSLIQRFFKSRR